MSLQHNTSYTMFDWTFLEVFLNDTLTFVYSRSHKRQENCLYSECTGWCCLNSTLYRNALDIHSKNIGLGPTAWQLHVTTAAEFLLTNVTREPSTFIVWLQQMSLELVIMFITLWTVSTWVRLCVSVNTNMTLQFTLNLKQLPTITTIMRSTVAV